MPPVAPAGRGIRSGSVREMRVGEKKSGSGVSGEGAALPVVQAMQPSRPRGPRAAEYEVEFGELPPPKRSKSAAPRPRKNRWAEASKKPAERYVAPDSHRPHGSYAKYVIERCRCEECTEANREYERRRRRAMARPDEAWLPYVPAAPARRHVERLTAGGMGLRTIAALSGVSHGALSKLIYGDPRRGQQPTRRVRPQTLAAILAVEVEDARGAQKVPAGPTWALIDELVAAGYTKAYLALALGSRTPALQLGRQRVLASTARAVEELHARLIRVPPPRHRTRWSR
jgi:hypothetical protein